MDASGGFNHAGGLTRRFQPRRSTDRDGLVASHAPIVRYIAYRKAAEPQAAGRLDVLIQVGLLALVEAADTFASSDSRTFEEHAWPRVHEAIASALKAAPQAA